jgi:glycosyltransferase involved in cell wall biosynthesis
MNLRPLLDELIAPESRARFWRMLEAPRRRRFQQRLAGIVVPPRRGEPAVNYGDTEVTESAGIVRGGRVKLRHFAEEFPAAVQDFNLLYLVSSAPPKFALDLISWAKERGVKFVWNQNGVAYPAWYGARVEELNGPMRVLRQQADFIFYQSEFCRQCAEHFLGPADAPGEIAFNCVDTAQFSPGPMLDAHPCQLLAAGSHYESYRVISVLETVAELTRRGLAVELHLAGKLAWAGAEAEVMRKIRALGLSKKVRRTAAYRQEEAPAIYRNAHILLHPKYKDPCPTVPIEAMACGVPVIGSASGGMPELVSREAGRLIDVPESWEKNYWPAPLAMADAVEAIMSSWPAYRAAARANAEARFSKEDWLAKHRRVFHSLITA